MPFDNPIPICSRIVFFCSHVFCMLIYENTSHRMDSLLNENSQLKSQLAEMQIELDRVRSLSYIENEQHVQEFLKRIERLQQDLERVEISRERTQIENDQLRAEDAKAAEKNRVEFIQNKK